MLIMFSLRGHIEGHDEQLKCLLRALLRDAQPVRATLSASGRGGGARTFAPLSTGGGAELVLVKGPVYSRALNRTFVPQVALL